ncbi:hypothetical protein KY314_00685 [Candidatus Woesearchaeota archaeon]|nr:hypothetical protein [Candidatus Woesearchaeota archaeon]
MNKTKKLRYPAGLFSIFFESIRLIWEELQNFFYGHKTIFDIILIAVYLSQQIGLLLALEKLREELVVPIFIAVLLSTISFERVCMQSRYSKLKNHTARAEWLYEQQKEEYEVLKEAFKRKLKWRNKK